jgi:tryptophan halogenase
VNEERAIRSIAVAGGGIVGLSAAIAFARAIQRAKVTVVETAPDPSALADRVPTAHPGIGRFHTLIGLDERELVEGGVATHHLGTIVQNWSVTGEQWTHAFGSYGKPIGAIPFDQIWARAHRAGKALAYDRYAMGAALARAGKFVHPARNPEFIGSHFQYGLRFDPERYRDRLRTQAQASNVAFFAADIGELERREDGGISVIRLTDGQRIGADLFVDCTGPTAKLIGVLDDSFEDWSAWMPFDWLTIESAASEDIPATADLVRAGDKGWSIKWSLRGKTMIAQIGIAGDLPIKRGRRLRPWVRNVLALGDSATALDPLHGFNVEVAQSAITLALELLPGSDFSPVETEEYNRRAEQVTRRVRDFIALHYVRGPWSDLAAHELPDSLARTLDQYEHRGRMPFHEGESVIRDSWTAALLGVGVIPRNTDPQANAVPLHQAIGAMERLAAEIEEIPPTLPSYGDYLAKMTR